MEETTEAELCFPDLLNSSCRKHHMDPTERLISDVLLSLGSILTSSLNLLVIIAIAHFRQLHSATNLIILSLAVSDFLIGLVVIPINGIKWRICWTLGDFLCALYFMFPSTVAVASVGTIVLISVDRYMAICDPLRYPTRMTVKVASISVCVCWLYAIIFSIGFFFKSFQNLGIYTSCQGECVPHYTPEVGLVMGFILPVSIIVVLYTRVFIVAVSQARAMRSQVTAMTSRTSRKSEIKAAKNLGVIVIMYLVCYCPFQCVSNSGTNSVITILGTPLIVIVSSVAYLNSCLNPLLYALLYPWFRKAIKLIVTLQILSPGSSDLQIL